MSGALPGAEPAEDAKRPADAPDDRTAADSDDVLVRVERPEVERRDATRPARRAKPATTVPSPDADL